MALFEAHSETRAAVGKVLIWSSEDGVADTIIPRLIRMGANMGNISIVHQACEEGGKTRPFDPASDMSALAAKAAQLGGVTLLIIDPVVAAVPLTRNSHNNAEMRNGLQPVVEFAATGDARCSG